MAPRDCALCAQLIRLNYNSGHAHDMGNTGLRLDGARTVTGLACGNGAGRVEAPP